ncbi:MAG: thrombospondin type 3 repeat-containing protein [Paludibacter sp.]|nr:thrombospondin type 3 repeat-containing protein [Paludibacter sp.]
MKTRNLLLMAFFLATQFTQAQTADHKFAIGLNVIRNEYNGDYGNGIFNFNQKMYAGVGLSTSLYLSPSFNVGLQGSSGLYGYRETSADRFVGRKAELSLFTHYKFNNGYIISETSNFSPFLSLGVGAAYYSLSNDAKPYPTIITNGVDLIIPFGVGLKYHITKRFAIQYQYLYNLTSGDNHDQNRGANYFGSAAHPYSKPSNDAYGQHVFSLVFNFGKLKDTDKDGVSDKYDKCIDTPLQVKVDEFGCPVDTDGDGVADYLDQCANTLPNVKVDAVGCPLDSDGDGVPDYLDKCPNTPAGIKVDVYGCSIDKDGDGVADEFDKCPDTPVAAYGKVDANGCPLDTDGDGVPDYLDKCPNTPAAAFGKIDANGCPLDTDGDGVPDYLDKCPNTPAASFGKVDMNGCPTDTDGDGIADYLDNCPKIAGTVANHGCPEVKKEVKTLFEKALQGIQFQTGKADIKPVSFPLLNQIANILILNPTYLIEVQGHTDNVGADEYNMELSRNRAAAVRDYLVSKGVDAASITSEGYGETKPVADNNTKAGKTLNRRVEFVVTFEK